MMSMVDCKQSPPSRGKDSTWLPPSLSLRSHKRLIPPASAKPIRVPTLPFLDWFSTVEVLHPLSRGGFDNA
jgi:hypothetical protein